MIKGYDIDGVITAGVIPAADGVIITGRSWEEAPETYKMLRDRGIFNAVYFNPVAFGGKTIENSGQWKAQVVKLLGVSEFHEDDLVQARFITTENPTVQLHLITEDNVKEYS